MPLLRFDAVEGRTDEEIQTLLDAAHRAMLTAFAVPPRDRYQIYQQHKRQHFIAEDTGLGIPRTDNFVLVSVTSMPRTLKMKRKFYEELCREWKLSCGIEASDVMVSILTNGEPDWTFGGGEPQFITGALPLTTP